MTKSLSDIVKILAVCSPLIGLFAGWVTTRFKASNSEDKALKEGVKMLLRVQLMDECLHYISKGAIPPYAIDTIKGLYASYLSLGDGDKSVGELVERVDKLKIGPGGG